jgi:hypothetical protein
MEHLQQRKPMMKNLAQMKSGGKTACDLAFYARLFKSRFLLWLERCSI